ncbi:MAG: hypothetical protein HPY50_17165 [Firmicutes bacterium]|nr:hypothetical protein [Bacillota bacterium]
MAGAHAIKPRWGQPMTGILAFIVFTAVAWITWFIFADPAKGVFRLYEQPFTAFLAVMIVVGVWQHIIFGDWPFQGLKPLQRGIAMTVTNLVITWLLIYVIFEAMGAILPFWSTETLLGMKLEMVEAAKLPAPSGEILEEMHHMAMDVKMAAVTFWVVTGFVTYPFWSIMWQKWPFGGKLPQPASGICEWCITTVITMVVYGLLVVPHFGNAAVPAYLKSAFTLDPAYASYTKAAADMLGTFGYTGFAPIWYADWAPFGAKNYLYIFGLYEWIVIILFLAANTWQGWPWNYVKTQPLRGLVGSVGMVLVAYIALQVTLKLMESQWGAIPWDAAYTGADAKEKGVAMTWGFRYYHAASIAGYTIIPFLMWHHYFDDFPNQPGMWNAGWWIRFVGVFALAAVYGAVWYKISYPLFGLIGTLNTAGPTLQQMHELVPHGAPLGTAFQVMNKPLPWIFWWIIPLLFNEWFMHKWPFYVEEHEHAEAHH